PAGSNAAGFSPRCGVSARFGPRRLKPATTGLAIAGFLALATVIIAAQIVVPRYADKRVPWARDRAILGTLRDPNVTVACYGREWGSLPFYLDRDDICNFTRRDWTELKTHLRERSCTYLIAKSTQSTESLQWCVEGGGSIEHVAHRGDINVFRVTF